MRQQKFSRNSELKRNNNQLDKQTNVVLHCLDVSI